MGKMQKMEYIGRAIAESFLKEGCADIHPSFMEDLKFINETLEKNGTKNSPLTAMFLSCIMTAQANAVNTMRGVFYRLFCGEDGMQNGNGGSNTATGGE